MRRIGEVAAAAIVVEAVAVGWSASPVSGPVAGIQTLTFPRTDTFTVPAGVQRATFEVTSANGGNGGGEEGFGEGGPRVHRLSEPDSARCGRTLAFTALARPLPDQHRVLDAMHEGFVVDAGRDGLEAEP